LFLVDLIFEIEILNALAGFFSKLAVVTFGGAYAVLAYMAQDVVTQFGWLTAGEMMDGLGLAETTPGPLILVTEFVGFLAAFKQGGFALGVLGAIVTLWVTFVPCFLWIFTGAPYIEWISAQPRLSSALSMITAAVVGVILNLSIWFGLHVFFENVSRQEVGFLTLWVPDFASLDWHVFFLSALAALLLLKFKIGLLKVLALSACLGWVLSTFG
jgi:chromate transporter